MTEERILVQREGTFHYPIVFRKDFSSLSEEVLSLSKKSRRICVVSDSHVAPLYLDAVTKELGKCGMKVTAYILPAGESNKNLDQIQGIYEHLIQEHFDRNDMLAALGGGVTGDMTGFAAATYLRGIDFIQIPTTLLSQVDSSIGGKTGVDFRQYKNMVGAFHQPLLVYTNGAVLKTLPDAEFASGMGEVIKHGLIRDKGYSTWLSCNREAILEREESTCLEMIYRSCMIKKTVVEKATKLMNPLKNKNLLYTKTTAGKTVVEKDPTEQGERAVLNMGHTIGHAIEKLKNFTMSHGACVAVGCAASAFLSMQKGWITEEDYKDVLRQLEAFHLPVETTGLSPEDILQTTKSDKKMDGKAVKFILLKGWGNAVVDRTLTDRDLLSGIHAVLAAD